jgi:hypothetical protein
MIWGYIAILICCFESLCKKEQKMSVAVSRGGAEDVSSDKLIALRGSFLGPHFSRPNPFWRHSRSVADHADN